MSKKNEIHVTIGGKTKSGKSRITHIIISALEEAGLAVEISPEVLIDYGGDEEKFFFAMEKDLDKAILAIDDKSKIVIKNVQYHRDKFK